MPLSLHLKQPETRTLSLEFATADVKVRGLLAAKDLALHLDGEKGEVSGSEMEIEGFEIHTGDLVARADSLSGKGMTIGWDDTGVRIEAASLAGPSLSLSLGAIELALGSLSVREVRVHGSEISVAQGSVASAEVRARFPGEEKSVQQGDAPAAPSPAAVNPTIFDWHLLDGLRGDFNVDLGVDLTVPVIGRRRATHRFRVPIEAGAVDYMKLENDLSTLENAILDFAVRDDGTLVLERGIPLLPTRGRGKPILIWKLEPEDLDLARQNRIRLAVFPHFEPAANDEPEESKSEGGSSPIALRSLSLGNLETRLVLGEGPLPLTAALRRLGFDELSLRGEVHHHPDQEPRSGFLRGEVKGLGAQIVELPLGANRLSLGQLHLGSLAELAVRFSGLAPQELSCTLGALTFESLAIAPAHL